MIILERQSDSQTVASWSSLPSGRVQIPGTLTRVHSPTVGMVVEGHEFKEVADPPAPAPTAADVNAERDRRINSGFSVDFGGGIIKPFDSNQDARDNIAGVHSFALAAIVGGAQPGDLRWADPDADFEWICADNTKITMDAYTAREFAEAAMGYKSSIIFAARVVKDMGTIPGDYANDQYWPNSTLTLG